jgi:hypothetical protein
LSLARQGLLSLRHHSNCSLRKVVSLEMSYLPTFSGLSLASTQSRRHLLRTNWAVRIASSIWRYCSLVPYALYSITNTLYTTMFYASCVGITALSLGMPSGPHSGADKFMIIRW